MIVETPALAAVPTLSLHRDADGSWLRGAALSDSGRELVRKAVDHSHAERLAVKCS